MNFLVVIRDLGVEKHCSLFYSRDVASNLAVFASNLAHYIPPPKLTWAFYEACKKGYVST